MDNVRRTTTAAAGSGRVYYYPFALALRLRVLQIVFGIIFLIVGTVAFIEEKGDLNLGLGIPTGVATIIAAATSIHTSRGFGGYRSSLCAHGRYHFGFLNPSLGLPVVLLWATACSLLTAVIVQCSRTLNLLESEEDLFAVAAAELTLALATLLIVLLHCRIDCKYDPD